MATENEVTESEVSVVKEEDAKEVVKEEERKEGEEGEGLKEEEEESEVVAVVEAIVDPVKESLEAAVPTRKERLQKVMADLEIQRAAIVNCTLEWKEFEDYFTELEGIMQKRLEDLVAKEKAFEIKYKEMQKALDNREQAVASREQAMLSRVQEQKDHAIASLFEEKRKWLEERSRLEAESAFKGPLTNGVSETNPKPEPIDRANADAAAITSNGSALHSQAMEVDVAASKPTAAAAVEHDGAANANGSVQPARKSDITSSISHNTVAPVSNHTTTTSPANPKAVIAPEVRVRPQLKTLCEIMDGDGLRKYIVDHRKDVGALRNELPSALQCAIDPSRMVLGALEGYHNLEPVVASNPSPQQPSGGSEKDKESGASANRRACILLLECLAVVLADPVMGADHPVVPSNVKESAKQVADQWKSRMNLAGDAAGNSLDAQAFLQLLATFGIATEYNDDELCKLVTAVARRRQTPALCRSLGLSAKIPDVVDRLAKEGKQIEALSFAHSFGIMDRVQPIPLLKAYLKEARRTAQSILKSGNSSAAAQNDATMKELAALKAVLKCIEEYQLESQYPSMPLQKRVVQLEKAKSDRKRAAVAVKAQTKRPRASNGTGAGYATTTNANNNESRNYYRGASDRGQYGSVGVTAYSLQAQNTYDRRGQGGYSTTYAGGNRSPVSLSSSYLYSTDGLGSPVYGSSGYSNPSNTYSSYQFGSGLPPPPPAYQASFLH
ncbi:hypothetical protein M758_4G008200 [Ceratodon purpureus]|nr:hypothetical protein M758_4G008200 [Ceratodon purpureus]